MTTPVRPTRDVVVFGVEKKVNLSSGSTGGIFIQDYTEESAIGTVIEVGSNVMSVKAGDKIVVDWSKAQDIGNNQLSIEEEHIQIILSLGNYNY